MDLILRVCGMKKKEESETITLKEALSQFPVESYYKRKRERLVYKSGDFFVKNWVPNWTQSEVTRAGFNRGFYDENTCSAFYKFIEDESGDRGYILKSGICFKTSGREDWTDFVDKTSYESRKNFLLAVIKNSIDSKGIHCDMFSSNLVLLRNKISLIDLDGYRSFSFLFQKKKEHFEKFDLDAWWKPHESAIRDVDLSLRSYLSKCLDVKIDYKIDSEQKLEKIKLLLESI